MADRAYTVAEIDELRLACERKWLFGSYNTGARTCYSRPYYGGEKTAAVEAIVRTHMLAGHTAADLYASEPVAPVSTYVGEGGPHTYDYVGKPRPIVIHNYCWPENDPRHFGTDKPDWTEA